MIHYGPWHLNTVSRIPLSSAESLKQKCSRNLETRHIHMLVPPAWTSRLDFSETNTLCLKTVCNVCMFSICLASRNAIGVRKGVNDTAATSASIKPSGKALWGMSCCTTYPAEHTAYATTDRNSILNCLYLRKATGCLTVVHSCFLLSFPLFGCNQTGALTEISNTPTIHSHRYIWYNRSSFMRHKIGTLTADMLFSRKRGRIDGSVEVKRNCAKCRSLKHDCVARDVV